MKRPIILIFFSLILTAGFANAQSPLRDVTDIYVVNPDFTGSPDLSGWILGWDVSQNLFVNCGYQSTFGGFEAWSIYIPGKGSRFSISQQIVGLPNGKYVLEAQAASMNQYGAINPAIPYLFANSDSCAITIGNYDVSSLRTAYGNRECTHSVECIVEDNVLIIGVRGVDMNNGCNWNTCGHFRLNYYGQVNVNVGQEGYVTFFDDVAHTIAEGAEVFAVVSDAPSGKASLNDLRLKSLGNFIPANTGVIIKAEPGRYALSVSSETSSITSLLEGGISNESVPGDARVYYTLCVDNGTPVFKKFIGSTLKAYKAYICIHASSNEDMNKEDVDSDWFD